MRPRAVSISPRRIVRPQGEMGIYGQDTEIGRWPRSRGSQRQPQRQRAESACAASDQRAESACIASVQSKRAGSSTVCDVLLVTHISSVVVASPAPPPPLPRSFSSVAHHPFSQRQSAFVHPPTSRAASPAVECSLCSLPPVWVAHLGFQVARFITPAFAGCLVIIFWIHTG